MGFAPVNNPAITILVVLDSPVGPHHGGEVGGPVFKRVAEQTLAYLGVPHDVPSPTDVETAKNSHAAPRPNPETEEADASKARFAEAVARGDEGARSAPTAAFAGDDEAVVPALGGETVRGVMEECAKVGLAPALIGSGIALEQFPSAGTQVLRGSRVTVRFGQPGDTGATARGSGN